MAAQPVIDHGYQVLGLMEVAELLGVDKRTPHAWNYRGLLPEADHPAVNGSMAWERSTIVRWAAATGRLPVELAREGVDLMEGKTLPIKRGGREAKAKAARERKLNAD